MDDYPEDYLKIYQYLFYMTCPNPDMNPFFYTPDIDKENLIMQQILGNIETRAYSNCKDRYHTFGLNQLCCLFKISKLQTETSP